MALPERPKMSFFLLSFILGDLSPNTDELQIPEFCSDLPAGGRDSLGL